MHALPAGETDTRIRAEVELQSATESLTLVLQLMDGTQVVFSGSQPVLMNSGQTAQAEMVVSNVLWGRIESINSQSVVRGQAVSLADSITVVARVTAGDRTPGSWRTRGTRMAWFLLRPYPSARDPGNQDPNRDGSIRYLSADPGSKWSSPRYYPGTGHTVRRDTAHPWLS